MSKQIEAMYENGVLRPLEPLSLDEHQRVTITIAEDSGEEEDLFDPAFTRWCAEQSHHAPSLEEVRQALSKIQGSMADIVIAERDEPQLARSFLDTSALVKYYHPEEGTGAVTQFVEEHNARHYISRLGIVEAQHAFAIKLRTGDITETDFAGMRQRLLRDIVQGLLQHVRVTEPHYREAERLIVT